MIFGFPWDTMAALWLFPFGLALFQVIYAYRSSNHGH